MGVSKKSFCRGAGRFKTILLNAPIGLLIRRIHRLAFGILYHCRFKIQGNQVVPMCFILTNTNPNPKLHQSPSGSNTLTESTFVPDL